jgi:hypothetical protein
MDDWDEEEPKFEEIDEDGGEKKGEASSVRHLVHVGPLIPTQKQRRRSPAKD